MKNPIKILHIDANWKIVYIIIRAGSLIKSKVPLKAAIDLLKKEKFDLIISEPHHKAILTPEPAVAGLKEVKDSLISGFCPQGFAYNLDPKPC
jgi:hypothetical protein